MVGRLVGRRGVGKEGMVKSYKRPLREITNVMHAE